MKFLKYSFFLISLIFINCQSKEKKSESTTINIDSIKKVTLNTYFSIPGKDIDSLKPYLEYNEIINNIEILDKYNTEPYTKEILKTAKFQCLILSGRFKESKEVLESISNDKMFTILKDFHTGVYYFVEKDYEKAQKYFDTVYLNTKKDSLHFVNCYQNALFAKLSDNRIDTVLCDDYIKKLINKSIILKTKKEVINKEVFSTLHL